ncbi:hypothetical protein PSYAE_26922 [Pseudomonas amygdali pv. aesculi str. 0893_23]|nr:hypothetical protein PSYAE_26922 [Pseudomonas amygdali pv. aesculi str. 0893_23]
MLLSSIMQLEEIRFGAKRVLVMWELMEISSSSTLRALLLVG